MPRYDFGCVRHGTFEATAGRDCTTQPCPRCGADAARELSVPFIAGATVARSIPDPEYRREADLRKSRASGWDTDRAVRAMRGAMHEGRDGQKSVNLGG